MPADTLRLLELLKPGAPDSESVPPPPEGTAVHTRAQQQEEMHTKRANEDER